MPTEIEVSPALVVGLRASPEIAAYLTEICNAIVREAKADPLPKGGTKYRQSFGVDVSLVRGGFVGIVYNTDRDAHWVEAGAHAGGVTPVLGYHIMTRALDRVMSGGAAGHGSDGGSDAG